MNSQLSAASLPRQACRRDSRRQRLHRQRHAAAVFILDDQVGRVGRDDAVFARQFGDFVPQLGVLAVQPDFVEQIADAPRGPEARDEFVVSRSGAGSSLRR